MSKKFELAPEAFRFEGKMSLKEAIPLGTVSYTHLDVYKRQISAGWPVSIRMMILILE